jgi:hypothetical protein
MNRINIEYTVCERISRTFPEKRRESLAPHNPRTDKEAEKETAPTEKKKLHLAFADGCSNTAHFEFINPANPIGKAA